MRRLKLFRKKKSSLPLAKAIYQSPESKIYNNNIALLASPGYGHSFNIDPKANTADIQIKEGGDQS